MNYKILAISSLFLIPFVSFAALTTDESVYEAPADVYFSGVANGNRVNAYLGETFVCQTVDTFSDPNLLTDVCDYVGTFDNTDLGEYTLIYQTVTDCQNGPLTRTQCCSGNTGCPGDNDATFEIVEAQSSSTPSSTSNVTSTMTEFETMLSYYFLFGTIMTGAIIAYKLMI